MGQRHECRFELPAQHDVGMPPEQVILVQDGVEAAERDDAVGIQLPHPLDRTHAYPQRRVHRHDDGDQPSAPDFGFIERFDGEIERVGRKAVSLEECAGPRQAQRLVAQLIAGDQEDGSTFTHRGKCSGVAGPLKR